MTEILWILGRFKLIDAFDILLVAALFYALLKLIRGTQAVQLLRGVFIVVLLTVLLSSVLRLTAFNWLLNNTLPALLVTVPVIFQPELRKALERLGRAGGFIDRPMREASANRAIIQVARACRLLSEAKHGGLIVLERNTGLQDYVDTGVKINSDVSSELLQTIFFPNTPLHDGAVIVREDQIVAAAALLPLGSPQATERHIGTRHRAAIGITEQTDAIAVVVSEETGTISVAQSGRMVRHLDENRLRSILQRLYQPEQPDIGGWLHVRSRQSVGDTSNKEAGR